MSDHFRGRIEIGGRLKAADKAVFCRAAGIEENVLGNCIVNGRFELEDNQAVNGMFEDLEALCRKLGLPYIRESDGMHEFSPEVAFWIPGTDGPLATLLDHGGSMQVDMSCVTAIRDALRKGLAAEALELAEHAVVELPELPLFEIVETD